MSTTPRGPARPLLRLLLALLVTALVAAACGDDSGDADTGATTTTAEGDGGGVTTTEPEMPADEPVMGGSIVVGLEAETAQWLPGRGSFANAAAIVLSALYDSLAVRTATGEIVPNLAESIEPDDDLSVWTVTLRPGVVFHDGSALTAEVVKGNFDEVLKAEGSTLTGTLANVESITVVDELTFFYTLTVGDASFLDTLTGTAAIPFSMEGLARFGEDYGDNPIGTGPFVFESWTRDDRMVVTRNPNYWRTDDFGNQLPYLDQVTFRPIPDEDTRLASVRSGDVDVAHTLRQSLFRQARAAAESGELQTHEAIGNNGGGAIFNVLVPPVDDVRVRLALAHGINQSDLIEILGGGGITPEQTQYYSPDSPWFSQAVDDAFPKFDADLASEILGEYVNDPARSDGKAPGSPVAVEFNCPPDPSLIELAQAYQAFWGSIGVEVGLNQVEQAPHIQNAIGSPDSDPPFAGSYMINCWRNGGQADPYTTLSQAFGPVATTPGNVTNFTSERLDANLQVLRESSDFDTRYAANEDIMFELAEQVPLLWTGGTATAVFARNEIRNIPTWTAPDGELGFGVLDAVFRPGQIWIAGG